MKFFAFLSRLAAIPVILTLLFFNLFYVPSYFVGVLTEKQKEQNVLLEAGYHWRWTGFVPGLWEFDLIDKSSLFSNIDLQLPLKYASFFDMKDVFDLQVKAQMEYQINLADADMVQRWQKEFKKEDSEDYVKEKVESFLTRRFYEFYQSEKDISQLPQKLDKYLNDFEAIQKDWQQDEGLMYFKLVSFALNGLQMPDIELYTRLSQSIDSYIEQKNHADLEKIKLENQKKEEENLLDLELARLKKIGELIRENPYILAYLRIEKIHGQATLVLVEDSLGDKLSVFPNPSENFSMQSSVKPKWNLPDSSKPDLHRP